ncbi:hypothetical protein SRABI83_03795 [Arthrobacter sp. Bi83]|uniref:hypothetical protein n=1 Tax=Arthrobacter sp. Bi83 TaxID=2822353 RepID=UPI001D1C59CA|nr:hypothetical protein [Arthrobacter sp. Bi83]CAH0276399.1 hypothetical protein SRABI83_03795 [Arthrobacter sp. Bi83]
MASDHPTPERREITVRRAPKYVPFLILGGLLGIAVAAIIAYALPGDASYDPGSVFGFFMVMCAAGGVILGAIAALILDRLSVRRTQQAVVEAVPEAVADAEQAATETEQPPAQEQPRDNGSEPGLRS